MTQQEQFFQHLNNAINWLNGPTPVWVWWFLGLVVVLFVGTTVLPFLFGFGRRNPKVIVILAVLALASSAKADDFTIHRRSMASKILLTPVREVGSTFKDMVTCHDKVFCAAAWGYAGVFTADVLSTHAVFNRCPTCLEAGAFGTGSRSTFAVTLPWIPIVIANLTMAHAWKNKVRTEPFHSAWPAGMAYLGAWNIKGIAQNSSIGSGSPSGEGALPNPPFYAGRR